jgi:hypothetical protein
MPQCILGSATKFGSRHSTQVCTRCGAITIFSGGQVSAKFDEEGEEIADSDCGESALEPLFTLEVLGPDTLQVRREGTLLFKIVERGEALEKMSPV